MGGIGSLKRLAQALGVSANTIKTSDKLALQAQLSKAESTAEINKTMADFIIEQSRLPEAAQREHERLEKILNKKGKEG